MQVRRGAVEVPANMGADQVDRAVAAVADRGKPLAEKHALIDLEAVGV
jgi:hypothetical protein